MAQDEKYVNADAGPGADIPEDAREEAAQI